MFNKLAGAAWGIISGAATSLLPGVSPQSSSSIAGLAGVLGSEAQNSALVTSLISSQLLGSVKEACTPGASGSVVSLSGANLFNGFNKKFLIKNLIKSKIVALVAGIGVGLTLGGILLSLKSNVGLSTFMVLAQLIKNKKDWLKILLFFGAVQGWFLLSALVGVVAPVPAIASAVFFIPSLLRMKGNLNKNQEIGEGECVPIQVSPIDLVVGLSTFAMPGVSKESDEDGSLNKTVTLSCIECFLEGVSLPLAMAGSNGSKTSSQILLSSVGWGEILLSLSAALVSIPLAGKILSAYEGMAPSLIKIVGLVINSAVVFSSCGLWAILLILVGLVLNKMELPSEVRSLMYFGAVL